MTCSFCNHGCGVCAGAGDTVIAEHNIHGMEVTVRCCTCDHERLVDVFDGPCEVCALTMGVDLVRAWRDRFQRLRREQEARANEGGLPW